MMSSIHLDLVEFQQFVESKRFQLIKLYASECDELRQWIDRVMLQYDTLKFFMNRDDSRAQQESTRLVEMIRESE